jgi:virulence-associated protein VapD
MATLLDPADAAATFPRWSTSRVYAIAFDFDTETLQRNYGSPWWQNAYREIRDALFEHGFNGQQGSVQFGGPDVTPVTCVLAVQDLKKRFTRFRDSVRDIRMLRIEESNDLRPVMES